MQREGFVWGAQAGGDAHPGHTDLCLLALSQAASPKESQKNIKKESQSADSSTPTNVDNTLSQEKRLGETTCLFELIKTSENRGEEKY